MGNRSRLDGSTPSDVILNFLDSVKLKAGTCFKEKFPKATSFLTRKHWVAIFTLFCFLSSSCATISPDVRRSKADNMAELTGFKKEMVKTDPFLLTAYARLSEPGKPIHIYIEGDGYAWVTPSRVSGDPTPRDPMVLSLAAEDPASNVVYLARPCQYTSMGSNPECEAFFWTSGRFSEEVVRSMSQAVSYVAASVKSSEIHLIGYSGGAAVAVLIAARRQDVKSLRTIAGNLDPELVNRRHGVNQLKGSLDPLDVADRVASIPQIHFVGGDDTVIPLEVTGSFLEKMGNDRCFQIQSLPEASHKDGWRDHWKELLRLPLRCQ